MSERHCCIVGEMLTTFDDSSELSGALLKYSIILVPNRSGGTYQIAVFLQVSSDSRHHYFWQEAILANYLPYTGFGTASVR